MVIFVASLLMVLGCAVAALISEHFKKQRQIKRVLMQEKIFGSRVVSVPAHPAAPIEESSAHNDFFSATRHSPFDALACLRHGDIDGARSTLQKIAYMVHSEKNAHPDQVRQFTELMCKFAHIDPLFWQCLNAIKPAIEQAPGIRQTALYAQMPVDVELARYVLYFAHETGHIVRRKKGNTYEVFLPTQEIPEVPAKRSRKKTAVGE